MTASQQLAIPTAQYTYSELADIYSRAREDYIVPMPMNAKRMEEYVRAYDIDLDASFVAVDRGDEEANGVCMLGIRGDRTWITRLGVIPVRRRRKSGLFLMESEIEISKKLGKRFVQLEVIKGNEPAQRLFLKKGFVVTRELLVIRRPPGPVDPELIPEMSIEPIDGEDVFEALSQRENNAAWTEETPSLRNAGKMTGLYVTLPDGEEAWIVFQKSAFQLGHFVLAPDISGIMMNALIAAVHTTHSMQDTKIENIPILHPTWQAFQNFGYMVAFGRIEMILDLA